MSATSELETPARPPAVLKRGTSLERKTARFGWVFLAPFAVVFLVFLVLPLGYAFWMSLHTNTLAGGEQFAGLANYSKAFTDQRFLSGMTRVAGFALVFVPLQIGLALVFALILDDVRTRLSRFTRLMIFAPYAIPGVIGALMWGFLYSPSFGPLVGFFDLLNMQAPDLLSRSSIFWSLTNIVTWQWTGYYMIIIYASLQSIDPSIYEAARIDGATKLQTALQVKVPIITSSLVLTGVFSLIGTLQFFTEPQVLAPLAGNAIDAAYTPNLYAYNLAFSYQQFNYASAISFALGLMVFLASIIFLIATRKKSGLN
ncbi:carbohydrate ABC transporter permease [Arthrobacter sunyaminii]|uniref:Sugar ABC transporter permease n=1 Tax=Arthrobacter sunyaminii TaxID=2816859 RepID=A0A975S6P6_9MICC|nr:sugar ABC transporter permease [Arthrobacter sunyaminii]MBO0907765.1 sugar ABC transporter permease [Arthrobacter sunyaminii]QWQ36827.1 sugar ABC transporter permease [Arthrobacter sunyaminii]